MIILLTVMTLTITLVTPFTFLRPMSTLGYSSCGFQLKTNTYVCWLTPKKTMFVTHQNIKLKTKQGSIPVACVPPALVAISGGRGVCPGGCLSGVSAWGGLTGGYMARRDLPGGDCLGGCTPLLHAGIHPSVNRTTDRQV